MPGPTPLVRLTESGDALDFQATGKQTAAGTQAAAIAQLTDSSGGTANDTIELVPAVGGSGASTAQETAIANNFADLAAKINAIQTAIRGVGIIVT